MKNITDFQKMKENNQKISMVTCYDYWSAGIINDSNIDAVLVGDSVAMVMHGYDTTINADIDMMYSHVAAVKRGLSNKVLIADMPFLAHRKGLKETVNAVDKLFKAGAQGVKIEGSGDHLELISLLPLKFVPVLYNHQSCGSIGGLIRYAP